MARTHKDTGSGATLTIIGSDKGGVGKSFVTATEADILEVVGTPARIVQIDDQDRLTQLYPDRITTVTAASLDDMRRDSSAAVLSFDPLFAAITSAAEDKAALLVDVGGPQQLIVEEYCALVDLDEDLVAAGIAAQWHIPATAEPEAMRAAVRTARRVGEVLPSVRRVIVLNLRDGPFRFYPGSPADRLWREELEPLCATLDTLRIPAIAAGSWTQFEAAGKRFVDVIAAEIGDIRQWTGRSHPAAKVMRGDVAAYFAAAEAAFAPLMAAKAGANG